MCSLILLLNDAQPVPSETAENIVRSIVAFAVVVSLYHIHKSAGLSKEEQAYFDAEADYHDALQRQAPPSGKVMSIDEARKQLTAKGRIRRI